MKNAKINAITGDGMFKENYKFDLSLDNGDTGKIYKTPKYVIDNIPYFNLENPIKSGDDIEYTKNDKGTIKITSLNGIQSLYHLIKTEHPGKSTPSNYTPKHNDTGSTMSKGDWAKKDLIKRNDILSCCALKSAVEKYAKTETQDDDVLLTANKYLNWLKEKCNLNNDVEKPTPHINEVPTIDVNDGLPF